MLDMRQYNHLFGSTRIPCHEKDIIKYGGTLNPQPRHIVIIRNGHVSQFYITFVNEVASLYYTFSNKSDFSAFLFVSI